MDYQVIVQQTKVESEALEHVTRALEVAIAWIVEGRDLSRNLSSVRFATELFQRQTERLFALEELDGYMDRVCRSHSELTDQVEALKREHEQCRAAVRQLVVRLDMASSTDLVELDAICKGLRDVMQQMVQHRHRESELLVQSINQDTGGEG